MLTLNKRPCKIGVSINARREMHGDEPVPAVDIPLSGIMIDAKELNELVRDPSFHDLVYDHRADSLPEPQWAHKFTPLSMIGVFQKSSVTLYVGLQPTEISFSDVKLAKIKLSPQVGGLTELQLKIQCMVISADVAKLLNWIDHTADVEIEIGELDAVDTVKDQPELNLQTSTPVIAANLSRNGRSRKHGKDPVAH
jgi:hypothetical protein